MRRVPSFAVTALLIFAVAPSSAGAHSAFLGSDPEPGQRLPTAPSEVTLTFTEPLDERLSSASLVAVSNGGHAISGVGSAASGKRLVLKLRKPLPRGAYRVRWHTVSTDDGHALEGSFSFGVRAAAVGGEHDVQQSPLARNGWLRVVARGLLYATLLVFCGALLLDALLRRGGVSWLVPAALHEAVPSLDAEKVDRRRRRLVVDFGFAAAGAAVLSAVADATDAAGGFSAPGLSDFLLSGTPGLTRLYVVVFVLLALAGAALRVRAAALPAMAALLSVSLSGHANASSPRGVAIANDWVHLISTALWLGGIALIVLVWAPLLRGGSRLERLAVARHVLPRFGRVALPAFAVVVATGLVSALIELGHISALWETAYGRVLMVKVDLVAFIAAASYTHAVRLRPRLLAANPHPDEQVERRHWLLLRSEPLLGLGVVAAVALLVAFPLPPRQLGSADEAQAAAASACNPCPLPHPGADELSVAEQGGSNVVAAWVRREGAGLAGTVRVYGLSDRPARDPFTVLGARQSACGEGCQRFQLARAAPVLAVAVRQRGRTYTARLPVQWEADGGRRARRLLERTQRVMRGLRSVREVERVSTLPGLYATTRYRLIAPDRMAYTTNTGVASVVLGETQWTRGDSRQPWGKSQFAGGLPFRTRSWFNWSTYSRYTYLLGEHREAGRDVAVVALMDPGTPAWWRLYIDRKTHRVLHDRLVTYGHFMTQRFFAANRPIVIEQPRRTTRGG